MIKVYITHSCKTCRMVIDWLEKNNIEFVTRNIFASVISHNELKEILKISEKGFDSIISTNSKIYKTLKVDLNDLTIREASDFIISNPSILRRPIMIDTERSNLVVGFNKDSIQVLLPKKKFSTFDVPETPPYEKEEYSISQEALDEIEHYKEKARRNNINHTQTIEKITTFDEENVKSGSWREKKKK